MITLIIDKYVLFCIIRAYSKGRSPFFVRKGVRNMLKEISGKVPGWQLLRDAAGQLIGLGNLSQRMRRGISPEVIKTLGNDLAIQAIARQDEIIPAKHLSGVLNIVAEAACALGNPWHDGVIDFFLSQEGKDALAVRIAAIKGWVLEPCPCQECGGLMVLTEERLAQLRAKMEEVTKKRKRLAEMLTDGSINPDMGFYEFMDAMAALFDQQDSSAPTTGEELPAEERDELDKMARQLGLNALS